MNLRVPGIGLLTYYNRHLTWWSYRNATPGHLRAQWEWPKR